MAMQPLALDGSSALIAAGAGGLILGILFVKTQLTDRKQVTDFMSLRNADLLRIFLLTIGLGTLLFFIAHSLGAVRVHTEESYFWPSVIGGVITGLGITLVGLTPLTAPAALASGKFQSIVIIFGMVLAIPVVRGANHFFEKTVSRWGSALPDPQPAESLFQADNPVWWLVGGAALLIVAITFVAGGAKSK